MFLWGIHRCCCAEDDTATATPTATATETVPAFGCANGYCDDTGLPDFWSVSISGVINDDCESCDEFNGDFELGPLQPSESQCLWESTARALACNTDCNGNPIGVESSNVARFVLQIVTGPTRMRLTARRAAGVVGDCENPTLAIVLARWELTNPDCIGSNELGTLTLINEPTKCADWPGNVTASPS